MSSVNPPENAVRPGQALGGAPVDSAHAASAASVLDRLGVSAEAGLDGAGVKQRRRAYGANRLSEGRRRSAWLILVDQFRSLIVYLLVAAAALSFAFGEFTEGGAIVAVLAINAAIGFTTEFRAVRSMEALRRLTKVRARVRRDGRRQVIAAEEIVPGDIVLLEAGDVVPADLRLVQTTNLQCDESALTGESVPVAKDVEPVAGDAILAERSCMAFKGTPVTRGDGVGAAVATGMATELGNIAALAAGAESEVSPLEKRLDNLGGHLVWVTLALTAMIAATGVYAGQDLLAMIKTAIALAVAAVPEGLPIVATIALARGMWRMARRNALIENLSAVETLGATTVILTDKTGTLTENRMTVARLRLAAEDVAVGAEGAAFRRGREVVDPDSDPRVHAALRVAALCNNARLPRPDTEEQTAASGDPMEIALLAVARLAGLERPDLLAAAPEAREEAFGQRTKMMATFHDQKGGYLVAVKGAPEAVIERCTHVLTAEGPTPLDAAGRDAWHADNHEMASEGLRVIALAQRSVEAADENPYEDLTLIGLVGLLDPPRNDVAKAIAACRQAGVRVVMLTGDHAGTARNIAREVGLDDGNGGVVEAREIKTADALTADERKRLLDAKIFARVSPETKLDLVSLFQQNGEVVAMTGDGVNDAPALKKADIGVAMGQRGTEVAREAADMVLRDDAFPSIVAAMSQGRVIFSNIRKFVLYLISCNLSEILIIGLATLSGLPLPLLPLQILYLNLVTDVFPAFALGLGEGDPDVMKRPPRSPTEPILAARHWWAIAGYSAAITSATLGAFVAALAGLHAGENEALTVSFLTLALSQLWHVFNMRESHAGLLTNEVTRNGFVWGAVVLCMGLIAAAVFVPGLSGILGMAPLGASGWALVVGASLVPVIVGQVAHLVRAARR